jgi:hypothetical protein
LAISSRFCRPPAPWQSGMSATVPKGEHYPVVGAALLWTLETDAPPKRSRNQYTKRAAPAQPEGAQPVSTTAKRDTRFTVGNPGRPKGALNKTTMAVLTMMEGEAEAITRTAIDLAKAGDSVALRLVMERLVSPVRERPVSIAGMPKINVASDLIAAASAVAEAAADGEITPGEAASLSQLVANTVKAVETFEPAERLAKLEEQMASIPRRHSSRRCRGGERRRPDGRWRQYRRPAGGPLRAGRRLSLRAGVLADRPDRAQAAGPPRTRPPARRLASSSHRLTTR